MSVDHDIEGKLPDDFVDDGGWSNDYRDDASDVLEAYGAESKPEGLDEEVLSQGAAEPTGQQAEGFSAYLAAIARKQLLTAAEERDLGKSIQRSRTEGARALSRVPSVIGHFVEAYQRGAAASRELTEIVSLPSVSGTGAASLKPTDAEQAVGRRAGISTAARKQHVRERADRVVRLYEEWVEMSETRGSLSPEAVRSRGRLRGAFLEVMPAPEMLRTLCAVCRALDARARNLEKRVAPLRSESAGAESMGCSGSGSGPSERNPCEVLSVTDQELADAQRNLQAIESEAGTDLATLRKSADTASRAEARYEAAWQQMVEANLRLVVAIARHFVRNGVSIEDLVQEGNIGLFRAAEKFDYRFGYKFSTYASFWIRQAIMNALTNQGRIMRVPAYMNDHIIRLYNWAGRLQQQLGRDPTIKELAAACDLPVATVAKALEAARFPVSLDAPPDERKASTLQERTPSDVAPLEQRSLATELRDKTQELVSLLDEREATIIKMHFGLGGTEPRTLEQIAPLLGISRERVRQIEAKAMKTLKRVAAQELREALTD